VVALTASVMAEDRQAARLAGMDGFALKPLEAKRLFEEIARVTAAGSSEYVAGESEQHDAYSPIDWQGGVARWGSKARLATALRQFLDGATQKYPLPDDAPGEIDWA